MRKCKECGKKYEPVRPMQTTCDDFACKYAYAMKSAEKSKKKREASQKKEAAKERAETRAKKQAMLRINDLIAICQRWCNLYIRLRDRDKGCFVCHKPFPVGRIGGDFDAGHVRSRGAAKHLRFNEDNIHGECKECNSPFGAKPHQIEAGAIERIGLDRYEALKNNNETHKWTREELLEKIEYFKRKVKEIEHKRS
jgi:hypothetical protein